MLLLIAARYRELEAHNYYHCLGIGSLTHAREVSDIGRALSHDHPYGKTEQFHQTVCKVVVPHSPEIALKAR